MLEEAAIGAIVSLEGTCSRHERVPSEPFNPWTGPDSQRTRIIWKRPIPDWKRSISTGIGERMIFPRPESMRIREGKIGKRPNPDFPGLALTWDRAIPDFPRVIPSWLPSSPGFARLIPVRSMDILNSPALDPIHFGDGKIGGCRGKILPPPIPVKIGRGKFKISGGKNENGPGKFRIGAGLNFCGRRMIFRSVRPALRDSIPVFAALAPMNFGLAQSGIDRGYSGARPSTL